jgi:hypothetical protein
MPGIETRAPERTDSSSGLSGSPKTASCDLANLDQRFGYSAFETIGHVAAIVIVPDTGLRSDGQARRHRQAEMAHLGQVCALSAQEISIRSRAFRLPVAKSVDPFRHARLRRCAADRSTPSLAASSLYID